MSRLPFKLSASFFALTALALLSIVAGIAVVLDGVMHAVRIDEIRNETVNFVSLLKADFGDDAVMTEGFLADKVALYGEVLARNYDLLLCHEDGSVMFRHCVGALADPYLVLSSPIRNIPPKDEE